MSRGLRLFHVSFGFAFLSPVAQTMFVTEDTASLDNSESVHSRYTRCDTSEDFRKETLARATEAFSDSGFETLMGTTRFGQASGDSGDGDDFLGVVFIDDESLFPKGYCEYMDTKIVMREDKICPSSFLLGPADAMVFYGCTPPAAKYFSFEGLISGRLFPHRFYPRTNFGDAPNHLSLNTTRGTGALGGGNSQVFDSTTVLIVTGNPETARSTKAVFVAAGIPEHALNVLPIPEATSTGHEIRFLRPGAAWWQAKPDGFRVRMRVHGFDAPDAGAQYMQQEWPAFVLRARSSKPSTVRFRSTDVNLNLRPLKEIPYTDLRSVKGMRPDASEASSSLDAAFQGGVRLLPDDVKSLSNEVKLLSDRVVSTLRAEGLVLHETRSFIPKGGEDWEESLDFNWIRPRNASGVVYPTRDAAYFFPTGKDSPGWFFTDNYTYVLLGVHNVAVGKGLYETIVCTDSLPSDKQSSPSIISLNDDQMGGTAKPYRADSHNLYAVRFERSCRDENGDVRAGCVVLPKEQFVPGGEMTWINRLVVDPLTGTGPNPASLVAPVLLVFREGLPGIFHRRALLRDSVQRKETLSWWMR